LDVPQGLQYLQDMGYLEDEFQYWFEHGVYQYATLVEIVLQDVNNCQM
jgi:hypothetical protein